MTQKRVKIHNINHIITKQVRWKNSDAFLSICPFCPNAHSPRTVQYSQNVQTLYGEGEAKPFYYSANLKQV